MFDPSAFPIRSCLRLDDEIVCNIGAPHHKKVHFKETVEYFGETVLKQEAAAETPPRTPTFPCLKGPQSQKKNLNVKFSFFETAIFPDGRSTQSAAATEERGNFWQPGAMDGVPLYVLNCQTIWSNDTCDCCFSVLVYFSFLFVFRHLLCFIAYQNWFLCLLFFKKEVKLKSWIIIHWEFTWNELQIVKALVH